MKLLQDKITNKQEERWYSGAKRYRSKPGFQDVGLRASIDLYNNQDYTMTVTDMCNILSASRSWIEKNFVPYVRHIYLPIREAQLYYSVRDFWAYYSDNAKASFQKLPDPPSWPAPDATPEEFEAYEKASKSYDKEIIFLSMNRNRIPFTPCDLPRSETFYNVGKPISSYVEIEEASRETCLRRLFRSEAIKILIFGKVYWVWFKKNTDIESTAEDVIDVESIEQPVPQIGE